MNEEIKPAQPSKEARFAEVLKDCFGQRHLVVLQDYPDPDAISSGFAYKIIAASFGIEADLVYCGRISHPENIALVKVMGIDMLRWSESLDLTEYNGAVFVDNQGSTAGTIVEALVEAEVPTLIIIDHHERQEVLKPRFADIRKTGATATILASYISSGLLDMKRANGDHVRMATALMHGLMTDTSKFVRARPEDFHAAAFLSPFIDGDLLGQITNQSRSKQTMEAIRRSLGNRAIAESFSIAGIGFIRAEDRDAIPQAADFLLTEENVHTAIVFGVVTAENGEEVVIGSMRTSKITIDPDEFLKEVFGKDASGRYFGGGKKVAGGFEIPVGFLSGSKDESFQDMKWKVFEAQIHQKIFAKIGVAKPPLSLPAA